MSDAYQTASLSRFIPNNSVLFTPIEINGVRLENRVWIPAMVTWLSQDGTVTEDLRRRYLRFAQGEPGMIVLEATGVHEVKSGPLLRISEDSYIPPLRGLVAEMHACSPSKVALQIIHFLKIATRNPAQYLARIGRQDLIGQPEELIRQQLTPLQFEDYCYGFRQRIEDLSREQIQEIPTLFARAAARARLAGFDGVELHMAHAYTLASFLSRLSNKRADENGQDRLRLPLQVIGAVRAEVGNDYPVGVRYLGDEAVAGGNTLEDAAIIGLAFAQAGVDYLSISRGGKFEDAKRPKVGEAAYPYTGQSGEACMPNHKMPVAANIHLAAGIKKAVNDAGFRTPVVGTGKISTFEVAESVLREGKADIIGVARAHLCDPDWTRKIREGRFEEIRRCDFKNVCELVYDQRHLKVVCKQWGGFRFQGKVHPP
ncbi:MAG: NADH:flavin oxidoreductase [Acidobacteria bacterium]|nr:NADH:flavin oxidoreductase [Acidobacteriota bacterium]